MSPLLWGVSVLLAGAAPPPSAAGVRLVEISTNSVDLTVQEGPQEQLEVYDGNAPAHRWVSIQGDRAVIQPDSGAKRIRVVVPTGRTLDVNAQSGDVEVTGAFERLMIRTVSGDIKGSITAREVLIKAMSGDIRITVRAGRARLETVTGDIVATGQLEDLQARSTSGDVEFSGHLPRGLETQTVSGNVTLEGNIPEDVVYSVHTVSGQVNLKGVGPAGFRLSARSRNGSMSIPGATTEAPGRLRLLRGNGRGTMDIQTLSGEVSVQF
jgi:DUF4097 and DUF4098 domain-containing protein YvlB